MRVAMDEITRDDADASIRSVAAVGGTAARSELIAHQPRKLAARPAWQISDLLIAFGLAALLLPPWLLPERTWGPLWRAIARIPVLTSGRTIRQTAKSIQAALGESDWQRAEEIAHRLKASIYELRMQDLRAWRPDGWKPQITLEGEHYLLSALGANKGAILWLGPCVFNSGPTKIEFHRKGYRVSHLSSPKHGFSETEFGVRFLNRVRCIPEDRCLAQRIVFDRSAPSTAMRRMMRALKAGEIVSIVAASTEGSEMVQAPILGGRLKVAVGAPRLAALTGAPLLPVFTVRDPGVGFRVVIEAPIVIEPERSSEERCIAAAI